MQGDVRNVLERGGMRICYEHPVLTLWGLYELQNFRDGPYVFKRKLSPMSGPLSFKLKRRFLSKMDFALFIECSRVLTKNLSCNVWLE